MNIEEVKSQKPENGLISQTSDSESEIDSQYAHLISDRNDKREDRRKSTEWTRVFSRDSDIEKRVGLFQFGPDLNYDRSVRDLLLQTDSFDGEILFSPQNFKAKDLPKDLNQSELDYDTLMHFAMLATKVKKRFFKAEDDYK